MTEDCEGVTAGSRRTGAISSSSSSDIEIGEWMTEVSSSSEIVIEEWDLGCGTMIVGVGCDVSESKRSW